MERLIRAAFVLGAGLGTRLRALTNALPKPLIPVANKPLITYAFDHLLGAGIERFIVNTHHCAQAYETEFPDRMHKGAPIEFRHEPDVLETAGGMKNVESSLGSEPFIVYNGDILTDLPLETVLRAHLDQGNEVTLALRSKDGPLQIVFDTDRNRVTDIGRRLQSASELHCLFTGVYVVNPEFLRRIPSRQKIGVVPIFREMIRDGDRLGGVVVDEGHWWDLGTREHYLAVHGNLGTSAPSSHLAHIGSAPWISANAAIHPTTIVSGATAIGNNVTVHEGARLHDCIVWEDAEIASGSFLERCVVTNGRRVHGHHADADL